jgi:hypothetical protein
MLTKDRNILGLAFYGLILPVIGSFIAHELFHDVKFTHYNVHAIIELSGASLAILIVAALLLNNYSEQKDSLNHNIIIIIGCALLSMAVFDIFHAISPVGNNFVWLHSLATFFGGLFFASVILLKYLPPDFRLNRSLLHITTTFSLAVSIFTVLSIISSPIMILDDDFTILSKSLNIIGGCGFIVASLFFYKTFREKKDAVLA